MTVITLAALLASAPARFYPQTWYKGLPFLSTPLPDAPRLTLPKRITDLGNPKPAPESLPLAVELVALYLQFPEHATWQYFLWCADVDHHGQRIYVGGVNQDRVRGLQIHRHLHITNRWGRCEW